MTAPAASGPAASGRLADFRRCSTAEEYFTLLGVDYDPRVLAVNRLHVLRHFANELIELHSARPELENPDHLLRAYREALIRSYHAFTTATALDHRLFKVLQDHAPESTFVPTSAITVETAATKPNAAGAAADTHGGPR